MPITLQTRHEVWWVSLPLSLFELRRVTLNPPYETFVGDQP
jgi:hypothetical protein